MRITIVITSIDARNNFDVGDERKSVIKRVLMMKIYDWGGIPLTRTARSTKMGEIEPLILASTRPPTSFLPSLQSQFFGIHVKIVFLIQFMFKHPWYNQIFWILNVINFWFNIRNIIGNSEHCCSREAYTQTLKQKTIMTKTRYS